MFITIFTEKKRRIRFFSPRCASGSFPKCHGFGSQVATLSFFSWWKLDFYRVTGLGQYLKSVFLAGRDLSARFSGRIILFSVRVGPETTGQRDTTQKVYFTARGSFYPCHIPELSLVFVFVKKISTNRSCPVHKILHPKKLVGSR